MEYKILGKNNDIAQIISENIVLTDTQSALDLFATVQYYTDCDKMIIDKSNI